MTVTYTKVDLSMVQLEAQMIQYEQIDELLLKGNESMISDFLVWYQPRVDTITSKINEVFGDDIPSDVYGTHQSLLEKFEFLRSGATGPLMSVSKISVAIAEIRALQLSVGT